MGYREAWDLQAALQSRLIEAKRGEQTDALPPHVLLLVEHPPVFTLGKSGDAANLLASGDALAARGATFVETDRGGDITFHGPGQVVAYPILDLDRLSNLEGEPMRDLHRFLREMEEAVIRTCADWNVVADRVPGRTGVWVGPDARGDERKVCAMGVRCSRWVTMHGLALNVTTDLDWFGLIVPCGIDDRGVTSLAREASGGGPRSHGDGVSPEVVSQQLVGHLAARLGLDLRSVERAELETWARGRKNSAPSTAA
ncbi:lipoyl(octanoyl) transferase [Rubricoccus marinus]|uniref:Octanoyltransferase n=2 Tax=Rubricoccus marinus TaxID=716817 RepID=A0A259TZH9_9BACT|nr:lipoyl(octanoyl) transferase [Rubricoccus marinus]